MSTLDTIDQETAATTIADADEYGIFQSSTGRTKKITQGTMFATMGGVVVSTAAATALTITQALHGNKVVVLNATAPIAITLPAATGTGTKFTMFLSQAATATGHTIKVANTLDAMSGMSWSFSDNAAQAVIAWKATATDDTVTVNGSTQGGIKGDQYEFVDVAATIWAVKLMTSSTGTEATPFSATV